MASKNAPTSSADLIRKHSTARYLKVNNGNFGTRNAENDHYLNLQAREALALKQF